MIEAKERLIEGRAKLRVEHDAGLGGVEVCQRLSELLDETILGIYNSAADDLTGGNRERLDQSLALVAHGGYGRRDVCPYSDMDLMLLHGPKAVSDAEAIAKRLNKDVCDAGLRFGFAIRTTEQARSLALKDAPTFTSLAESRLVHGDQVLFDRFMSKLEPLSYRRQNLLTQIEASRKDERSKFGETVFLLRPNIKRSKGGLRDIQFVRWIGFARYGESNFDALVTMGALAEEDRRKLEEARTFLLQLRNELHFNAEKTQDVLGKNEQVRVAEVYGYEGREGMLPVEQFMSEYFEHTSNVRYCASHFLASARARPKFKRVVAPVFSIKIGDDFRMGPFHIGATRVGMEKTRGNLVQVLRLMELANVHSRRIDHETWESIRDSMTTCENIEMSDDAADRFLALLGETGRLVPLIRRLHEMRVLEKIIPAFSHARCLLQFNEYHKYTVDEHSIRALMATTDLQKEDSPTAEVYRSIKDKTMLHLAILLHDLGKGYTEDHSDVGLRIAEETACRLNLSESDAETVKLLVHKHLMMSHLAFRRNITDENVVAQLAAEVGSTEVLKMLYILTCADLSAVGPGVLNAWKTGLLHDLYERTRHQLKGAPIEDDQSNRTEKVRAEVVALADNDDDRQWLERNLSGLSANYLDRHSSKRVFSDLLTVKSLGRDETACWAKFLPKSGSLEIMVAAHDRPSSGIFHRLTGALSSSAFEILAADLMQPSPLVILNRFLVHDIDFSDAPPQHRIDTVTEQVQRAIEATEEAPPTFRSVWRSSDVGRAASISRLPTRVKIDNQSSEKFTIIDVFAHDRVGLLYTIAKSIYQLNLDVRFAKIGTYLDQVVDVFYVTDHHQRKIVDEYRLQAIRQYLLSTIEDFENS